MIFSSIANSNDFFGMQIPHEDGGKKILAMT